MKISLGMIVKDLVSEYPIADFLDNAQIYGHKIDSVIIAYSNRCAHKVIEELSERTRVIAVKINDNAHAKQEFKDRNIADSVARQLLWSDLWDKYALLPYGFNRNTVLIEAILIKTDVLIFVDSDVAPVVLTTDAEGNLKREEVDFIGRHIDAIKNGADITTSDYSGYNILPPAEFEGMEDLLIGVQKESMTDFWRRSNEHQCFLLQERGEPKLYPTEKVLGGNMAIKMSSFPTLPPFFSAYYFFKGTPYLARGEDTLFGYTARQKGISCMDIDMHIFHDTYGDYPHVPNLARDKDVQNRLFYACTGWIGRNPFINWLQGKDLKEEREKRAKYIRRGAAELSLYTSNEKFLVLNDMFHTAWDNLPDMIDQYEQMQSAWNRFIERSDLL